MEANIETTGISIRNKQEIFIRLCQQDCDLMWDIDIVPTINYELKRNESTTQLKNYHEDGN
jgi:hypothetical protein